MWLSQQKPTQGCEATDDDDDEAYGTLGSHLLPFLKIGVTDANFQMGGIHPSEKEEFMIWDSGYDNV